MTAPFRIQVLSDFHIDVARAELRLAPGADRKGEARSKGIARWPAHAEAFARVMDHDRAEAALIGVAELQREAAGR